MTGYTHLIGGIASLTLPVGLFMARGEVIPPDVLGVMVVGAVVGALAPDLDASESLLKSFTIPLITRCRRGSSLSLSPFALPAAVLHQMLGHRTLLHSLLGVGISGMLIALPLAYWIEPGLGGGFLLGYLSHLALDACTVSGIRLLYPAKRRFHLMPPRLRVSTGSPEEGVVLAILASLALAILLSARV